MLQRAEALADAARTASTAGLDVTGSPPALREGGSAKKAADFSFSVCQSVRMSASFELDRAYSKTSPSIEAVQLINCSVVQLSHEIVIRSRCAGYIHVVLKQAVVSRCEFA